MKRVFTGLLKFLVFTVLAVAVFSSAGCGGGGGGDSSLSPEELEVAAVLDAFAAAVNEENHGQAMTYIFSNLKYYGGPTTAPSGITQFDNRLQTFFAQASGIKCEFTSPGITLTSETTASVRALMVVDYLLPGDIPQVLTENVELVLEKDKRWGIVEFAQYGNAGTTVTAFPPQ